MTTEPRFTPDQLAAIALRFWPKVDRSGPGCWPWQASRNASGYGKFGIAYRTWSAPRVAWVLAHGPIPDGLWLLHHCDNPPCVKTEPDERFPDGHLFLGTHADNMADMAVKGRSAVEGKATGGRNGAHTHPESVLRGDGHWTRQKPEYLARGDGNGARLHPERLARGDRNGGSRRRFRAHLLVMVGARGLRPPPASRSGVVA
jgi:hypothetical protein